MDRIDEIQAREQAATPGPRDPKAVVKSLRWILNNVKDYGPNTFEHAIHGYVGEAIQILEDHARLTARVEALEMRLEKAVELPCEVGDTVYQLRKGNHAEGRGVSPRIVSCAVIYSDGKYSLHHQGQTSCRQADLGKTWFLTREEAEAALQEGLENGQ